MITFDNYAEKSKSIDFSSLPEVLKKGHEFVKRVTVNFVSRSAYDISPSIKKAVDQYFAKLNEFLATSKAVAPAKKKAKQVAAQASRGERFTDLARDNSDAATAKDGGVLGSYKKGELSAEVEAAVWDKPRGYITPPIKLPTGFDIFRVDNHTKAGLAPLADVKPEIENQLYGPKMEPKVREYLTELRRQAFLQIKPGFVDTGAAPGKDTSWVEVAQLKPETVTKAEVEEKTRHKRLLGIIPIPGTETTVTGKSSSR